MARKRIEVSGVDVGKVCKVCGKIAKGEDAVKALFYPRQAKCIECYLKNQSQYYHAKNPGAETYGSREKPRLERVIVGRKSNEILVPTEGGIERLIASAERQILQSKTVKERIVAEQQVKEQLVEASPPKTSPYEALMPTLPSVSVYMATAAQPAQLVEVEQEFIVEVMDVYATSVKVTAKTAREALKLVSEGQGQEQSRRLVQTLPETEWRVENA